MYLIIRIKDRLLKIPLWPMYLLLLFLIIYFRMVFYAGIINGYRLISGDANDTQEIYDKIYADLQSNKLTINLENVESEDILNRACKMLIEGTTDVYYVNKYSYLYYDDGRVTIDFKNNNNVLLDSNTELLESLSNAIIDSFPDNLSEYEKVKVVHDYIIENYSYDYNGRNRSDALSIMRDKQGVCSAYSMVYKLLLNKMGVECEIIISSKMDHCWNIVKIGSFWYHVDVTWDDDTADKYRYFLLSDTGIRINGHYSFSSNTKYEKFCISKRYEDLSIYR